MHSKKTRYFKRRFAAGMLAVIMLSGTLPDDMVLLAAEAETETTLETEPIQAVEETKAAETVEVWETEQTGDRLSLEEQETETQSTQSQPIPSSTAHETEIAETKEDELQQETKELITTEENHKAASGVYEGFGYSLYSENEAEITGYFGSDTSIDIPATVDGYVVKIISIRAFYNNKSIESVSMPDTITLIAEESFSGCTALTDIKLPKGLESIGRCAFNNCTALTSIEIPKTLNFIENYAGYISPFKGCTNLKTVSFEEGTTQVMGDLFRYCNEIESVELPDTVTDIEEYAFKGCVGLTNIKWSKGLEHIGQYAFDGCIGLTNVELPDSITDIGSYAFNGCTGLTNLTLSKGLEGIGSYAFADCTGLTSIEIPKSLKTVEINSHYSEGPFKGCCNLKTVSFEEGTTRIIESLFQMRSSLEEVILPNTVTVIEDYAFYQCTSLKEIVIPDTVTDIGYYAFAHCDGLTSVKLSKGLENIESGAFRFCSGLTDIEIPKSLKTVGLNSVYNDKVFEGCANLKTASFEEGTTQIVNKLFDGCSSLEKVEMPYTVISIGDYAFRGCTGLTDVKWSNSLETIRDSAFLNCTSLVNIELPYTVISIGDYAFSGCSSLTDIKLPRGLTTIGSSAFSACIELTDIEIPKGLKEIGTNGIFYGCTNLKNISFEKGITNIAPYLFTNCTGLEYIEIPDTVTTIGLYAFSDCVNLIDIKLPDTIKTISWYAFENCSSLQSITFPDSVSSNIFENVLNGCTSLKEVVFSDSMTSIPSFKNFNNLESVVLPVYLNRIPEYAFYNTKLTQINLPEKLTSIEAYAFANTELTQISLPDSVEFIGERIFAGCDSLSEVTLSANITKIPAYAFDQCQLINNIIVPASVTEIEAYAFAACPSLTSITIPRETTVIDPDAFYHSDNITIRGISGSYAESFAKENEIPFVDIGIWATQIEVSSEKLTVFRGGNAWVSLKVTPEGFMDEVQWIAEDPDIVTVSKSGLVSGISVGTTTVRVLVGNLSKDIEVTVIEPVSQIELSTYSAKLKVGDTLMLIATVHPDNATNPNILWSSSDSSVAKVDENGMVTATNKGTATIRAKATDRSGCSAFCTVTVSDGGEEQGGDLTALHLKENSFELWVGEGHRLEPVYEPVNTKDDTRVTWTSSNPHIVDVDSTGYITALAPGTSVITVASVIKPELTDTCMVTVNGSAITVKECTITFETNGGSRVAPITCKSGNYLTNIVIEEPVKEGYIFTGWYKDLDCTMPWHMDSDIVMEDTTFYAAWMQIKTGLWATPVVAQTYTGKGIKPAVEVYSGTTKLVPNRDYSLSYKNNVNVYTGGVNTKKPQIIIKGKGNYKDSKVIYFDILPKQISDTDVIFDNLYVDVNTQPKQLTPTALWNTKKLKYNKNGSRSDYKVTFSNVTYDTAGIYPVTVTGLGNYGGTREISLIVSDKELLNKATVSVAKSASYNGGKPVMPENLIVKLKGKTLSKNSDYIVICKNNTETGTAVATIRGIGSYSGEKRVNFNIVGEDLKNAYITGIVNKEYTGDAITQDYAIRYGSKQLKLNEDFTLRYQNNVNTGTASMIFTGINGYSGTVKKTFKVLPFDIQTNKSGMLKIDYNDTAQYRKSGAQPKITVFLGDRALVPDIDYKLSYKNNKITSGSAQFQMKGLGNFKGSVQKSFTVINTEGSQEVVDKNKDISKAKIKVKDQIYTGKAVEIDKSDISSIMIGTNGVGSDDYEILEDTYQNNVKKGTAKVTIRGKNGYGGEKQITFKITTKSISYLE